MPPTSGPKSPRPTPRSASNVPQVFVDLDREKAKTLNIAVSDVFQTMQAYLGSSYYVNDFNLFGRVYRVMIQADGELPRRRSRISATWSMSETQSGEMVPLKTLIDVENVLGPVVC